MTQGKLKKQVAAEKRKLERPTERRIAKVLKNERRYPDKKKK